MPSRGVIGWLRANLFSNYLSAALTVGSIAVLALIIPGLIEWAFIDATLTGEVGKDCPSEGACWAWLDQRITQFFYGFYPADSYWRVNVCIALLVPALAYMLFDKLPYSRYGRWFSLAYPVIAAILLVGGLGLDVVRTDQFGGFMLNLIAGPRRHRVSRCPLASCWRWAGARVCRSSGCFRSGSSSSSAACR